MDSFIELKDVSVLRDKRKVLDDVSLSINSNENVVIIGPNGSGKSTFIKLIIGKVYPSYTGCGSICRLFGCSQWNIHDLHSMLGIVTSDLEYDFHNGITGFEAVISGFFSSIGISCNHIVTRVMIEKTNDIIEFLDITFLKNESLANVSSGEVRKFLIARALVNNPKVLILDEPSNNLDIASSTKLHSIMRKISASGTKILLVTHLVSDIIPEINRFIFFKNGKIFADGKRSEVFRDDKLSSLFDMKLRLSENNGLCNIVIV